MCVWEFVAWADALSSYTLVWGDVRCAYACVCVCGAAVVRGHFAPPCPGQTVGETAAWWWLRFKELRSVIYLSIREEIYVLII